LDSALEGFTAPKKVEFNPKLSGKPIRQSLGSANFLLVFRFNIDRQPSLATVFFSFFLAWAPFIIDEGEQTPPGVDFRPSFLVSNQHRVAFRSPFGSIDGTDLHLVLFFVFVFFIRHEEIKQVDSVPDSS